MCIAVEWQPHLQPPAERGEGVGGGPLAAPEGIDSAARGRAQRPDIYAAGHGVAVFDSGKIHCFQFNCISVQICHAQSGAAIDRA
jgi:hypothetical protein